VLASVAMHADVTIGVFNTGNCYPMMCNDSGTDVGQSIDYQQVYTSTAFNAPMTINAISWYYDHPDGGNAILLGGTYTVFWGYAAFDSVNNLSTNLASNYISNPTMIASVTVPPGGINDDPGITLTLDKAQQFTYDPTQGNLLLEIVVTNQDNVPNGSGNGYDEADLTGLVTSRAYCVANQGCVADAVGLVTTFAFQAAVPEPGSLMMLGTGVIGLGGLLRRRLSR
jgi:hypothetical protein